MVFHRIVPLLCFYPSAAWLLLTVLQFLSYKIFINYRTLGDWQFDPFFQCSAMRPFIPVGWEILRGKRTTASPEFAARAASFAAQ